MRKGGCVMKRIAMMRKLRMVAVLAAAVALPVYAQTLEELKNDGKNTDNVLTYGMGYHQNRYSSLKQINKSNVKRLVPVWNLSLDNQWGEQAQPLVYNGVMYVTNARHTVIIDVATLSGLGGVNQNRMREQLKNVPYGGSVWTFALMPE